MIQVTFTKNVFTGKSSGTTLSSESYSFAQISARYVRITVNGNTENNWASISEIKVNGNSTQPPPSNRPPITNAGPDQIVNESSLVTLDGSASHDPDGDQLTYAWTQTGGNPVVLNNANTTKATFTAPSVMSNDIVLLFKLTVTDKAGLSSTDTVQITVTHATNSGNGVDKFGIKEIYPTKQGGEEWFVNMNNPNDGRNEIPSSLSKNPDGTFKVTQTQVRWGVFTTSGYHPNQIATYNQKQLAAKGYMQSPNDWKNTEITGYVKLNKGPSDQFTWYARGGTHTSSRACEGTSIKGQLFFDGHTRYAKEQWHPGGYSFTKTQSAVSSIQGRWVGFKTAVYNFQENGKTMVKMENWVDDKNNNNWVKIYDFVDRGGFGNEGGHCGGDPDQIITWGGPIATFRWDQATDVDIKNMSVREIQPPVS